MSKVTREELKAKYLKARKEIIKKHERDYMGYVVDACRKNYRAADQNRKASQKV